MQKECKGRPIKQAKTSEPNGLKVIRLMSQGLPPPGMRKWPRAQDRRRLDPKPLIATVRGVIVYKREYQEHSDSSEAAWRQRDREEEENEEKEKRHNEAGAAHWRVLAEEMKVLDIEMDECTANEEK